MEKPRDREGMLGTPLPAVDDPEGAKVPEALPFVVDAHVHLFPDALLAAIRDWFDRYGWPIRYRMRAREIPKFLLSRGIGHVVALHYAHRPGVARELNTFMADVCRTQPGVTGMATVFPGERDAISILKEGFDLGLCGVKLHAHVQCFDMEAPEMHEIYGLCEESGKPLVMHVGREPKSPAYACDPYLLCSADRLERILKAYPGLRICVPHLGADEFAAYGRMLEVCDNLWLDTTMALADYLPIPDPPELREWRADRIMYGTDFPHIPYAWDRELRKICSLDLPQKTLKAILGENARAFFGIEL